MYKTPPKKGLSPGQSLSEPDIPTSIAETDPINITVRNRIKRQRLADSPNKEVDADRSSALSDFKSELLDMLSNWKSEQEKLLILWKDEQSAILTKLVSDVAELKLNFLSIQESNAVMDRSMSFINKSYENLTSEISKLKREKMENAEVISRLQKQVQDMNFMSRQATIELRNIPNKGHEKPEELIAIVSAVGKTVDMNIQTSAFRDVYRIPGKTGLCRPIVAEFGCVNMRNEFLTKVKKFNKERSINDKLNTQLIGIAGEKKPVYVDEHLPPAIKKLLYDARQFAKARNYSSWYSNGRILLRKDPGDKPVEIKSEKCLTMLTEAVSAGQQ